MQLTLNFLNFKFFLTSQPQILFKIQFFEIGFVLSPANNPVKLKQDP